MEECAWRTEAAGSRDRNPCLSGFTSPAPSVLGQAAPVITDLLHPREFLLSILLSWNKFDPQTVKKKRLTFLCNMT